MCDHRIIAPINQCEFTGLERNITPLESRSSLKVYSDNYGQQRYIAVVNNIPVAGLLLSGDKIVRFIFTLPEYRRQGFMRELYATAYLKNMRHKIRFDDNLTDDGRAFAFSV